MKQLTVYEIRKSDQVLELENGGVRILSHWRRKGQTTPVFSPEEAHEQYEQAKRYDTGM